MFFSCSGGLFVVVVVMQFSDGVFTFHPCQYFFGHRHDKTWSSSEISPQGNRRDSYFLRILGHYR